MNVEGEGGVSPTEQWMKDQWERQGAAATEVQHEWKNGGPRRRRARLMWAQQG